MQPNIGWLFYKDNFRFPESVHQFVPNLLSSNNNEKKKAREAIQINVFEQKNRKLYGQKLSNFDTKMGQVKNTLSVDLQTTYPGLLIGSGYTHEVGAEGEFKLGFFFDHTTGLPTIPGSSVKGVLRSVFPSLDNKGKSKKHNAGQRIQYIKELLTNINVPNAQNIDIDLLEKEIFDGIRNGKNTPVYKRDIFHDTIIAATENKDKKFLGDDSITPHGNNPLKNPIPLKFMKILPQVKFRFQFHLENGIIDAEQKLQLFEQILKDIGIGAKTNVGYGKLNNC